jgi:membrane fusion protein, multidrug efflux system
MPRAGYVVFSLALALSVAACQKGTATDNIAKGATNPADPAILVAAEDIITLHTGSLASGTVITGSIEPERRADLRAEVSAVVLQVLKENGESVRRGDLLVRLDDTAIRDSLSSAVAAERAAGQALDQAERQFQRLNTLRASGMASAKDLEDAEIRRNNAQSDKAAAEARTVQARQQMQRTEVRAPFDGIVSERKASAGDTAAIGKELIKVIDPSSLRFEGFVSGDKIGTVKVGQTVAFRVNGYGQQEFSGVVKRIDPAADPTTRQVAVLVSIADSQTPRVSGLYAEGRIETSSAPALMAPEAALVRNGDNAYVWRLQGGVVKKVMVALGPRDPRHGDYVVQKGLADGDQLIRNPQSNLKDGAKVTPFTPAAAIAGTGSAGTAAK